RQPMADHVLSKSLEWLRSHAEQTRAQGIALTLFGGEPMLYPELLERVLLGVRQICEAAGMSMRPVLLTTNGLHAETEALRRLKSSGVRYVQISLDGSRPVNDSRRHKRITTVGAEDRTSVYESIIANLKQYEEIFDLTVKINFDKSTIESVRLLLDDLVRRAHLDPTRFEVKIEP